MKKICLAVLLVVLLSGYGKCSGLVIGNEDSFVLGIQNLRVGTFYDFRREQLLVGGLLSIVEYKQLVSVNVGLITQIATSRIIVLSAGINLFELCKRSVNLEYKLTKPLVIGGFLGKSLEDKNTYSGIYAGAEIKF